MKSRIIKKHTFNIQEYISLREELIQRLAIVNAQSHTAVLTIITAFAAGISLGYGGEMNNVENSIDFLFLNILRAVIFLIPIAYLVPLSVKSGENLIQIASLSAYIRVFYDMNSLDGERMNWETSNNILSNANIDKGKNNENKEMKLYNEEYTVLAAISFLLFYFFSYHMFLVIEPFEHIQSFLMLVLTFILLCIISLLAVIYIHENSGMANTLMKYTPILVEKYIKRAEQLGVIEKSDMKYYRQELDPRKSMVCDNWYKKKDL